MLIDGRKIAKEIKQKLRREILKLPFRPVFCDILVGDDPASAQYVRMKAKTSESIGIEFLRAEYPGDIVQAKLEAEVRRINLTPRLCGLIMQLPLPKNLNTQSVVNQIDPEIDVDCLNEKNIQMLYEGSLDFIPPTPAAVLEVLDSLKLDLAGKHILVIGQGELVGRPLTYLLKKAGLRVTPADKYTSNLIALAKTADILISAAGKAKLVTAEWVKPGAVVIDAGTVESDGAIVGDVDFESVAPIAAYLSPVPGGVGPVTVGKMLENVVSVAKKKARLNQ